jgi:hypothetical protein
VVDLHYLYNAIFGRALLNTFEDALHSANLCLKVPALLGVILVHNSQKDARNVEQGFPLRHRNVNYFLEEEGRGQGGMSTPKAEANISSTIAIATECKTKRLPLDPTVPDKTVMISQDLTAKEETELLSFLDKNNDVFAWKTSGLMGVSRSIIKHRLHVNPSAKLQQPRRRFRYCWTEASYTRSNNRHGWQT